MTEPEDTSERPDAHLRDIADGCGCAEVWEHTSAAREEDADVDGDGVRTGAVAADDDDSETAADDR